MRKLIKAVAAHRMFCLGVALWSLLLHGMFTVLDPLINKSLIDIGLVEHRVRMFAILAGAVVLVGVAFRLGMLLDVLLVRRLQNALTRSLTMRMLASYFGAACPEVTGASPESSSPEYMTSLRRWRRESSPLGSACACMPPRFSARWR